MVQWSGSLERSFRYCYQKTLTNDSLLAQALRRPPLRRLPPETLRLPNLAKHSEECVRSETPLPFANTPR